MSELEVLGVEDGMEEEKVRRRGVSGCERVARRRRGRRERGGILTVLLRLSLVEVNGG